MKFNSTFSQILSILSTSSVLNRFMFGVVAFGTLGCVSAFAGSTSSNMSVSATVSNNCTVSAGSLNFGAYDPITTNHSSGLNGSAALTVTCTQGASATITLGQGLNAANGSTDASPLRQLSDGNSHVLSYALFQDSSHSNAWGNTSGTGASYTGQGTSESVNVYGQVSAGQNVPQGSYSDTVVATVTF
jgi:spore coat protein U-like protein